MIEKVIQDMLGQHSIKLELPSGAVLSIIAGENMYSTPRKNGREIAYTHVEVGIIRGKTPVSWREYSDGSLTDEFGNVLPEDYERLRVFGFLPVELLVDFFESNK